MSASLMLVYQLHAENADCLPVLLQNMTQQCGTYFELHHNHVGQCPPDPISSNRPCSGPGQSWTGLTDTTDVQYSYSVTKKYFGGAVHGSHNHWKRLINQGGSFCWGSTVSKATKYKTSAMVWFNKAKTKPRLRMFTPPILMQVSDRQLADDWNIL